MRVSGRSVKMPSTPRSSSRSMVGRSSTVHTCTCLPRRCAARTSPGVVMRTRAAPDPGRHGDLEGRGGGVEHPGQPRREAVQHDPARARGRRRPGPPAVGAAGAAGRRRTSPRRPARTRRASPMASASRSTAASALASTLNRARGERLEQLGEGRDRVPPADPDLGQLERGPLGDGPGTVRHPVQQRVVERQQIAVGGGVDVGLEVAVAERDGGAEGVQRVLAAEVRCVRSPAAVGEGEERRVEEGVLGGAHAAIMSGGRRPPQAGSPGHGRPRPGTRTAAPRPRGRPSRAGRRRRRSTSQNADLAAPAPAAEHVQGVLEPQHQPVRPVELARPDGEARQHERDAARSREPAGREPEEDEQQPESADDAAVDAELVGVGADAPAPGPAVLARSAGRGGRVAPAACPTWAGDPRGSLFVDPAGHGRHPTGVKQDTPVGPQFSARGAERRDRRGAPVTSTEPRT